MSEELDYLSTQLYDATPESFQLPIVSESTHGSCATTGQVRGLHRRDAVVRRPRLNGGGLTLGVSHPVLSRGQNIHLRRSMPKGAPLFMEQQTVKMADDTKSGEVVDDVLRGKREETRRDVASLPSQQLQVMANPEYERLVKLIFEGRMIGESANRRSGIEQERAKSLREIAEAVEMVHAQGLDDSSLEVDAFLKQSCSAIESFNREVTMTWLEAENTCNLFKKQIGSILSAGSIRAAANVYTGDETEMRARLKRKYAFQILSLNNEISGRKKKGKLPPDATVILKEWWSKNLVWPYPSEDAKRDLEAQTGLSATQINNWFINQRKRHWHKYFKDGRLPQTINEARAVLQQYGIV